MVVQNCPDAQDLLHSSHFDMSLIGKAQVYTIRFPIAEFHLAASVLCMLAHCHAAMAYYRALNRTKHLLMFSATPVIFLPWQVIMSAVKKAY